MNNIINLVIIGLCIFASGWLFTLLKKQRQHLKIKAYLWNTNRIFIVILICISILPLISEWNHITSILRSLLMIITMILMFFLQDGVGDEGVFYSGQLYTWDQISQYDYYEFKKRRRLLFVTNKSRPNEGRFVDFECENDKVVQVLLQKHIARKLKRTKK